MKEVPEVPELEIPADRSTGITIQAGPQHVQPSKYGPKNVASVSISHFLKLGFHFPPLHGAQEKGHFSGRKKRGVRHSITARHFFVRSFLGNKAAAAPPIDSERHANSFGPTPHAKLEGEVTGGLPYTN